MGCSSLKKKNTYPQIREVIPAGPFSSERNVKIWKKSSQFKLKPIKLSSISIRRSSYGISPTNQESVYPFRKSIEAQNIVEQVHHTQQ